MTCVIAYTTEGPCLHQSHMIIHCMVEMSHHHLQDTFHLPRSASLVQQQQKTHFTTTLQCAAGTYACTSRSCGSVDCLQAAPRQVTLHLCFKAGLGVRLLTDRSCCVLVRLPSRAQSTVLASLAVANSAPLLPFVHSVQPPLRKQRSFKQIKVASAWLRRLEQARQTLACRRKQSWVVISNAIQ